MESESRAGERESTGAGLADTTIRSSDNLSMIIIEMKIMPDAAHALHTNAVNSHASVTGARDSLMYDRTMVATVPEPVRVGPVAGCGNRGGYSTRLGACVFDLKFSSVSNNMHVKDSDPHRTAFGPCHQPFSP